MTRCGRLCVGRLKVNLSTVFAGLLLAIREVESLDWLLSSSTTRLKQTNVCSTFDNVTLTTILLYHVTEGRRLSPGVINGRNKQITMPAGGTIRPWGSGSLVVDATNSSATIVAAAVLASNGIIHVIDSVLPP